jgi:hypothetical protein
MKKNMYTWLASMLALFTVSTSVAQVATTQMTLQPNSCNGNDAMVEMINGLPNIANTNYGNSDQLIAEAWTFYGLGGTTGFLRFFLDFNELQSIPQYTPVSYAYLSLYGVATSGANNLGSYGSNAGYVQRVTSAWNESTVTWNTQPGVTTTNQVSLPGSAGVQWNYNVIDLNVTTLLQDIINQPPASRYGFAVKLQSEVYYSSLLFGSSEHADTTRHPKLRIGIKPCTSTVASTTAREYMASVMPADRPDETVKNNGLSALVKTNLSSNQLAVDYTLPGDGKTTVQIVTIEGVVLKSMEVEGTKGKHTKTITLDTPLLKNKMAVLVVTQGTTKTASPFMITQ